MLLITANFRGLTVTVGIRSKIVILTEEIVILQLVAFPVIFVIGLSDVLSYSTDETV